MYSPRFGTFERTARCSCLWFVFSAVAALAMGTSGCAFDAAAILKGKSGQKSSPMSTPLVPSGAPSAATASVGKVPSSGSTIASAGGDPAAIEHAAGGIKPLSPEYDKPPKPEAWVKPRVGVEQIKPMAPTWCPSKKERNNPDYPAPDSEFFDRGWAPDDSALKLIAEDNPEVEDNFYDIPDWDAHILAWSSCVRPDNKNMQAWVAIGRQVISNAFGFSEADNRAFLSWALKTKRAPLALGPKTASDDEMACKTYKEPTPKADPEQSATADVVAWATGCLKDDVLRKQMGGASSWIALNRFANPGSEILKAAYVGRCLHSLEIGRNASTFSWDNTGAVGEMASCSVEMRNLNRSKMSRELSALKLPERLYWNAFKSLSYVATVAEQTTRQADALIKKIPDLKDVLVDAPAKAFKDWDANYKANKSALDRVGEYQLKFAQAQNSRRDVAKAFGDCHGVLTDIFGKYLRSKKVKSLDNFMAASGDTVGSQIVASLVACNAAHGFRASAASMYQNLLSDNIAGGGPRAAACTESMKLLTLLEADRTDIPFRSHGFCTSSAVSPPPWIHALLDRFNLPRKPSQTAITFTAHMKDALDKAYTPDGAVASVKKEGAGAVVAFKAEKYKAPVYDCRYTDKIAYWEFLDGKAFPRHEEICTLKGYETRVTQIPDTVVPAYEAANLKPGTQVRAISTYDPEAKRNVVPIQGTILEVYKDSERTKLTGVFGFEFQ